MWMNISAWQCHRVVTDWAKSIKVVHLTPLSQSRGSTCHVVFWYNLTFPVDFFTGYTSDTNPVALVGHCLFIPNIPFPFNTSATAFQELELHGDWKSCCRLIRYMGNRLSQEKDVVTGNSRERVGLCGSCGLKRADIWAPVQRLQPRGRRSGGSLVFWVVGQARFGGKELTLARYSPFLGKHRTGPSHRSKNRGKESIFVGTNRCRWVTGFGLRPEPTLDLGSESQNLTLKGPTLSAQAQRKETGNRGGKPAGWRWGTRTSLQTSRSCEPLVHVSSQPRGGQRRAGGRWLLPLWTGPQTPRPSRACHVTGTRQTLAFSAWSFPTAPPSGPWQVLSSIPVLPRFLNVSNDVSI